ncbi:MAG: hypothetical protein RLZZ97_1172, partial [Gemmatimonadota bacterium]
MYNYVTNSAVRAASAPPVNFPAY